MHQSRFARNILLGIENLLQHKLRSFLTMLGVVFGVGSVVAMLAVGEGASREAMKQIEKLGSNNIIINSIKSIEEESTSTQRSHMSVYGLTYMDYQRINETFPNVRKSVPAKLIRKEARVEARTLELRIVGTTQEWFELVPRPILAGKIFGENEVKNIAPVVVLTEFGARKLLATKNTIGQTVRIGGDSFEVIGIIKSEAAQAGNIQIPDQQIDAYIPISTVKEYFGDIFLKVTSGSFTLEQIELHQIIVQADDIANVESTAIGIERMLKNFHKKADYEISVPLALLKQAEATKRRNAIVLGSIACISLLVGGIGIMNIMLASVTERTREIGIRRAIGARRSQIITQFLIEAVVLSTLGGIVGLAVGIGIPCIITYFSDMPTVITLGSILLPLFISVGIGIIFGLYPAVNAAKVDPIIALRHE
ncbi:MAG TPA: macrolide export ATP-binding/permease MacB [Phycisphaerales bacterium]|nr:MAG: macrolide export ATP-binding/permease MacB [Planctomycetes bacterium GWC2_45_44]HBG78163.1 macrolide export ATP-binding/permease MacB [Phycisphaerales bacterium]HBR19041.1 macrolide export ATP-binding/permease MacB [Phycisphaerales bacterium]